MRTPLPRRRSLSFLEKLLDWRSAAPSASRRFARPRLEELESRELLTFGPVGTEFQINTFTTSFQHIAAVAMDFDGDSVAIWQSVAQDGDGFGVYGQRYNAAGGSEGDEFRVNTFTTDSQQLAKVAMNLVGDFVVVWASVGQDGSGDGIYAQRFNAAGIAQGSEFKVNTFTTGDQSRPVVAMNAAGDFIVAWQSTAQDGSGYGIYAQRYNALGVAQGGEFQVNSTTTSGQRRPGVGMNAAGDFVISWESNQDGSGYGIYARRYNATGGLLSGEFQVNTFTTGGQINSTVAVDASGDFVIAWEGGGQDGSSYGIFAQRFNSAGAPQGTEFPVNTFTTGHQRRAAAGIDRAGNFIVVWASQQDGDGYGIYAQRYDAAGAALGSEFRANTFTTSGQQTPAVAVDADGDLLIAWQSFTQDGSFYGVYAQRYEETDDLAAPLVFGAFVPEQVTPIQPAEFINVPSASGLTVVFTENLSVAGGTGGANSVINPANWVLTRNGINVAYTSISFGLNAATNRYEATFNLTEPLTNGFYTLTAKDAIHDLAGLALDGDANGTAGGDYTRNFAIDMLAGGEFRVNTTTFNQERSPATAMDADGDYVIAWEGIDGSGYGIFAQRYNAAGVAQGTEFRVNTVTGNHQRAPAVAMDFDGDFVVAWNSYGQDGSGYGIYAQRYNAAGIAQGGEFRVNSSISSQQRLPAVGMDAAGNFVVAWQSPQDNSGYGVYAQRYNAAGAAQGAEFRVNTFTGNNQLNPTLAMNAAGDFAIAWQSPQDGSGYGVYAQRYNAAGAALGSEFRVNTLTVSDQMAPTLAMDASGDFMVAWQSYAQDGSNWGVFAQRFNAAGTPLGAEFRVNTHTASTQINPAVATDADGDFVVAWQSVNQDGSIYGAYFQRFSASGAAQGEFRANNFTIDRQNFPALAMSFDGDFVIAWQSFWQDLSGYGIYAQRYQETTNLVAPLVGGVYAPESLDSITEGQTLLQPASALAVAFSTNLSVAGGAGGANSVINPANWTLTRNSVDFSSNITSITFGFNASTNRYEATFTLSDALRNGDYVLTAKQAIQDLAGNALDGDANGAPGGDFNRAFSVNVSTALGTEYQVNTFTNNSQVRPAVASNADGDYVAVWQSFNQDGSDYGIYAQRYNAAGAAQGSEFRVNASTSGRQRNAAVSMDAAGNFVVVWESPQDGSGYGVYAQRYTAAGLAQGGEFLVNTVTTGSQRNAAIAMNAAGDFVVAWDSHDGNGDGVYARRYNAAGVAQGGEFLVNTFTNSTQNNAALAMNTAGDFVVAWQSIQDGSSYGIYAQRYNAAGAVQGSEFRVNTFTANQQLLPSLAMDSAGDFVIAWQSYAQDGDRFGIYAQRYDAAGAAQGSEFRANAFVSSFQTDASVAMDQSGDFVIVWQSYSQDGSNYGIYAQRYQAAGSLQGSEFRVNSYTTSRQQQPAVAMDATGDFVVAWASNRDGSGYGIYAQRYGDTDPTTGGIPALIVNEDAAPSLINLASYFTDVATYATEMVYTIQTVAGTPGLVSSGIVGTQLNLDYAADASGLATITVRATDEHAHFVETTLLVNVLAVNDLPVAVNDAYMIAEDGTLTANGVGLNPDGVLDNDSDVDGPGPLTASLLTSTAHGMLTFNSDGTFTYQPDGDFHGSDTFSYRVSDAAGAVNFGAVTITVTPVNDDPTAVNDSTSVAASVVTAIDVLTNDSADPDVGETLTITAKTNGAFGTVVITGGGTGLTYQSSGSYSGPDSFTYTISDGNGGQATATVQVNVIATSVPPATPIAAADIASAVEDGAATNILVLANDQGSGLFVAAVTQGLYGTIVNHGTHLSYDPATPHFTGIDNFTYTVEDADGDQAVATVFVVVTPVNDAPSLSAPASLAYRVNTPLAISGIAIDDIDAGSSPIQVTLTADHGTLTLSNPAGSTGNGTANVTITATLATINGILGGLSYQANRNYGGSDTILVEVDDLGNTGGGSLTDSAAIALGPVSDLVQLQPSVSSPGKTDLIIYGTNAAETISVALTGTSKTKMTVKFGAVVKGKAFAPTGNILIYGLDGNDTITVNKKIKKGSFIDGGNGNDTLTGGGGNDILLGGAGNDRLVKSAGKNLLIGGADADVLLGGKKDDILIGGATEHDDDGVALDAVMAEWTSLNSFNTRTVNLAGLLNGTTVTNDAAADSLTGGLGLDWFWSFAGDSNDFVAGEKIN